MGEYKPSCEPAVHRCDWDGGWHQYHDEVDPLPAAWDDEAPTITPLYTAAQFAAEVAPYRQALDLLAGLHPGLTTDEPDAMAQAIFDAVLAEHAALQRRIDDQSRSLEWWAKRPAASIRTTGEAER